MKTVHFDYLGRTLIAKLVTKDNTIHSLRVCDSFDLNLYDKRFLLAVQKYLTDEGYFEEQNQPTF